MDKEMNNLYYVAKEQKVYKICSFWDLSTIEQYISLLEDDKREIESKICGARKALGVAIDRLSNEQKETKSST